jgi:hypothetical protein
VSSILEREKQRRFVLDALLEALDQKTRSFQSFPRLTGVRSVVDSRSFEDAIKHLDIGWGKMLLASGRHNILLLLGPGFQKPIGAAPASIATDSQMMRCDC